MPLLNIKDRAFTLMELMVAALILALVLAGLLASYVSCFELTEIARNISRAINSAQTQLEVIKNTPYDDDTTNDDDLLDWRNSWVNNNQFQTFQPANFSAGWSEGFFYVDDSGINTALKQVTISVCFKQQNGRITGEDRNWNGAIDTGEDVNANGFIDSPVEFVTFVTYLPTVNPEIP